MRAVRAAGLGLLAAALLAGCGVRPGATGDGPGRPIEAENLPEVVPRDEPRSRYGNPDSYVVNGQRYHVRDSARGYTAEGTASWYGRKFHGRRTSSGETYDMYALSAAHRTLPLPSYVRVTNLDNGRSSVVRVNDRGPFVDNRVIDLSYAAATRLGVVGHGTAHVRLRALTPGDPIDGGGAADGAGGAQSGVGGGAVGAAATAPVFLQVGAFRQFDNAERMRARVRKAGVDDVAVEHGQDRAGRSIYRVRIGPLADGRERRALLDRLGRVGIEDVRFITE